jgi:hypothetical protein
VARQRFLSPGVGERLLAAKLRLLSGSSERGTSAALSILTGGSPRAVFEPVAPAAPTPPLAQVAAPVATLASARARYEARTVYLSERHLRDIDHIIAAWQHRQPSRWTRSAVLRQAIEHLRAAVDADPDSSLPENA